MINEYATGLISDLMELDFYRAKRYSVPMTIAIFESDCSALFENTVEEYARKTDLYQYLDNKTFAIIFGSTDAHGAEIAINKLVSILKVDCMKPIYVGYSEVKNTDAISLVTIKRAATGLKMARKQISKNIVVI